MSHLLQVVRILWVETDRFLKNTQRLFNLTLLPENDGFNKNRVVQKSTLARRHGFLDQVQALGIILHANSRLPRQNIFMHIGIVDEWRGTPSWQTADGFDDFAAVVSLLMLPAHTSGNCFHGSRRQVHRLSDVIVHSAVEFIPGR